MLTVTIVMTVMITSKITANFFDEDIDDKVKATPQTTINVKVVPAMKKLQASYNNDTNKIIKQARKEKSAIESLNFLIDLTMITNDTKSVSEEPKTLNEAWDHPNANSCAKWWQVFCKKFIDKNKQQVWSMTSKSLMPPNCK